VVPGAVAGISCPSVQVCQVTTYLERVSSGAAVFGGALVEVTDQGATARVEYAGTRGSDAVTTPVFGGAFTDVDCSSVEVCQAVTANGPWYRTTDGGVRWSADGFTGWNEIAVSVSCPTTEDCVVGGGLGSGSPIALTNDGGATWRSATVPGRAVLIATCADTTVCEAVSPSSDTAFGSVDGGSSWSPQSMPAGVTGASAVTCATPSRCFAVEPLPNETKILTITLSPTAAVGAGAAG
jgi:hypothetical protein